MKFSFFIFLVLFSLPGLCQEGEDELIDEVYEERNAQGKVAEDLNEATEKITEQVISLPDELKKLGHDNLDLSAMADDKVVKLLQKTLKQSSFQNVPLSEVKDLILEKAKGHPLEGFLKNNPRLLNCLAELLKDKEVMSSAVGIFIRKKALKIYFFLWLGLMVVVWYIKRNYRNNKELTFFKSIAISVLSTLVSLSIFYMIFYNELSPAVRIIKKNFF